MEHFRKKLHDTFDVLDIFKNRCKELVASRELFISGINFISDLVSQTEMLRNYTDDALSIDREYVLQLLKSSSL